METVLFRLVSGEEIIAKVVTMTDSTIEITDAVSIVYHPTNDGRMSAGFAPLMPYTEDNLTIYKHAIAARGTVKQQMLDQYNRVFSNIVIAPASAIQT